MNLKVQFFTHLICGMHHGRPGIGDLPVFPLLPGEEASDGVRQAEFDLRLLRRRGAPDLLPHRHGGWISLLRHQVRGAPVQTGCPAEDETFLGRHRGVLHFQTDVQKTGFQGRAEVCGRNISGGKVKNGSISDFIGQK